MLYLAVITVLDSRGPMRPPPPEALAEVEAAAKKIRDSLGGTSMEIVLSPAIKKVS